MGALDHLVDRFHLVGGNIGAHAFQPADEPAQRTEAGAFGIPKPAAGIAVMLDPRLVRRVAHPLPRLGRLDLLSAELVDQRVGFEPN